MDKPIWTHLLPLHSSVVYAQHAQHGTPDHDLTSSFLVLTKVKRVSASGCVGMGMGRGSERVCGVFLTHYPQWLDQRSFPALSTGSAYVTYTVCYTVRLVDFLISIHAPVFDNEAAVVFRHRWRTAPSVFNPLSSS